MTTEQLQQGNEIIDKIIHIQRRLHHQEIALKNLIQSDREGMQMVDVEINKMPVVFKIHIKEAIQHIERDINDTNAEIGKLKDELEKL